MSFAFIGNEHSFLRTRNLRSHTMSISKTVRTTALHLAKLGHHVIATGRKVGELDKLKSEAAGLPGKLDTVALDVTSQASIETAVAAVDVITKSRGVDVLVNNAGFGVL